MVIGFSCIPVAGTRIEIKMYIVWMSVLSLCIPTLVIGIVSCICLSVFVSSTMCVSFSFSHSYYYSVLTLTRFP